MNRSHSYESVCCSFVVILTGENCSEWIRLIRYDSITFACNLFICWIWSQRRWRAPISRLLLVWQRHVVKPSSVCWVGCDSWQEHLGSSHSGWRTAEWALLDQTHTALLAQSNLSPMGHTTSGLLSPWSSVEHGHRKLLKSSLLPSVLEPQTVLCFPCKKWVLFLNVQLVYAVTLFLTQEPSTNTSHSLLSTHFSYSHDSISIAWQLFTTKHNICLKA